MFLTLICFIGFFVSLFMFIKYWWKKRKARLAAGEYYKNDEQYQTSSRYKNLIGLICIVSFILMPVTAPQMTPEERAAYEAKQEQRKAQEEAETKRRAEEKAAKEAEEKRLAEEKKAQEEAEAKRLAEEKKAQEEAEAQRRAEEKAVKEAEEQRLLAERKAQEEADRIAKWGDKETVKNYLDTLQPFAAVDFIKSYMCGIKGPVVNGELEELQNYVFFMTFCTSDAKRQIETYGEVAALCHEYFELETEIAAGYYNSKKEGFFSISTAKTAANLAKQQSVKSQIKEIADWSGAELSEFSESEILKKISESDIISKIRAEFQE